MPNTIFKLHPDYDYYLQHHGGKNTVTGSCHQLTINGSAILIDCGLFQGHDTRPLEIEFPLENIDALLVTHAHIDHIGRLPWLIAAGFERPIYCTEATAALVPLMLEDGLKLQGLDRQQTQAILDKIGSLLRPVPYHEKLSIKGNELHERCAAGYEESKSEKESSKLRENSTSSSEKPNSELQFCFRPAGHILGSAYLEIKLPNDEVIVFSGDLGPRNTPLLPDPIPPKKADYLVIESTYGNKKHEDIATRSQRLEKIVERSLQDGGVILIPAFSIGRTQELLFDIEHLIAHSIETQTTDDDYWQSLPIILDSPLASKVTQQYQRFKELWGDEAKYVLHQHRHPLAFEQCVTVESFKQHQDLINRLTSTAEPAIVVAASGMCNGGRIMDYLKALLPDPRTDIILAGYQAEGTLGRTLQEQQQPIVNIDNEETEVNAQIHTMSGYSAHADQSDLLAFIQGLSAAPKKIFLIHGEPKTKQKFKQAMSAVVDCEIID